MKEKPRPDAKCCGCDNPATKFCEAMNGPYQQPMTQHGAFSMSVGCGYPICDDCEHIAEDKHQHKNCNALLVWWTDQPQAEAAQPLMQETIPLYIRSEFDSRMGRNGRGRLWSHADLPKHKGIFPWPDNDLAKVLGDDRKGSGGIVILKSDWPHVALLPGLVTDMQLNPLDSKTELVTP